MAAVQSVYLDNDGQPRLRRSIVGFLDLLGFSQMATAQMQPEEAQQLLGRISAAIEDSRSYVRQVLAEDFMNAPDRGTVKFFSDNLVLGYSCETDGATTVSAAAFIIRCAQRYQLRMALNGFFLRGGLTLGPVCLTDDIIFGASLIESYQLESKTAIVPRVVLSAILSDILVPTLAATAGPPAADMRELICRDIDGWWFVNYLQAAAGVNGRIDWDLIRQHQASVLAATVGVTRHDVLPKFGWVSRYHNIFCHWHRHDPGYVDDVRITRHDENSTILRLEEAAATRTCAT